MTISAGKAARRAQRARPIWRPFAGAARRAALALALGLALPAGSATVAVAQDDFFSFLRPPGTVPQAPRNRNNGWWPGAPIFQQPQPRRQPPPQQQPAVRRKDPPPEPEGVVYASADAATQNKRQPPSRFVLVIGDRMAGQLAQGLADLHVPDRARIAIVESSQDESGFLSDPVDWMQKAPAAIAAARPNVTVVALGADDLRPVRDGEALVEPLTERWLELYAKRVDDVLAALRDKAGRVIVVGLAPVASAGTSDDFAKLNDLLRTRAARAGLPFVNVWDGFVDEDGKYLSTGPAVDGQRRRLRTNDGVRFTRAGGRKLAFFVQKDLNRLLEDQPKTSAPGEAAGSQRALSLAGGPAAAKGIAAPIPVSGTESPNAMHALQQGFLPPPVRGRTDDFSWPPPGAPAPAGVPR